MCEGVTPHDYGFPLPKQRNMSKIYEPLRIYVASAYSPQNCSLHDAIAIGYRNTEKAIECGIELLKKGHYVFVPHLSHYIHINKNCPLDIPWYSVDNSFLEHWANAFFYLSKSNGADAELELAKKLGLEIFYSLDDVPNLNNPLINNNLVTTYTKDEVKTDYEELNFEDFAD